MTNPASDAATLPVANRPAHAPAPPFPRAALAAGFVLVLAGLAGMLMAYVGLRLLPDMAPGAAGTTAGAIVLALCAALIPAGLLARALPQALGRRLAGALAWTGLIAGGFASSLLVLAVLRDLLLLSVLALPAAVEYQAAARASAWGVVATAMLLTAVGLFNARRRPRIVQVDVPLAKLPPGLQGFTITQISDVHVGPTIRRDFVQRIVDQVNDLGSDLVAITGDLVDGSVGELAAHVAPLAGLKARYGSFFVTGNHEYYSGAAAWVAELERLGLAVLQNEHVVLRHGGAALVLAGVTDFSAHRFDARQRSDPAAALAGAPEDAGAKVLLAHQPRSATAALAAGFDLQLSGHTHGGQFLPWNFFVRLQQPFTAGLHRLEELWVYTSRGTGYWGPPKRLGAPAEITRLRLVAADA